MADVPFMDEERHAERARQDALWLARGQPVPSVVDEEVTPEQLAAERFSKSPFGWVDNKLKGAEDWVKKKSAEKRAPFDAANKAGGTGVPYVPTWELPAMMALGGVRTANRWLYGTQDPSQLRPEDSLGPLGMSAMAAPFVKLPAHALGANAFRRGAEGAIDDVPFDLPHASGSKDVDPFEVSAPAIKREDGEIFDYASHDGLPPGNPLNLEPLPPYQGPRGLNERMSDLVSSPKVSRGVNATVDKGLKEHGDTVLNWYNMLPLRERFHDLYRGGDPDDAFLRFNQSVAAMSPQNPVPENMAQGSWLYNRLEKGQPIPDSPKGVMAFGNQPAMGTRLSVARKKFGQEGGYDPVKAPKTEYFGRSLAGDDSVPVIDSHAVRTIAMATKDPRYMQTALRRPDPAGGYSSFSPQEMVNSGELSMKEAMNNPTYWGWSPRGTGYYPATVPFMRAAEKFDISPGQAQAAAWYGNAEKTGVVTEPKTAMQILEDRIRQNATARNKSPEQMLDDMINGKDFLLADQVRSGTPAIVAEGVRSAQELSKTPFTRQVDDLGYYSKLDEVLGTLRPTDTVTMDTLAKRGVKAAEIEARGLSPFIAGGKGAKVSELQSGAQPVQVKETRYNTEHSQMMEERDLAAQYRERGMSPDQAAIMASRVMDKRTGRGGEPKWRDYATDGDNPSYHEGVLHLPLKPYDQLKPGESGAPDFRSGHWDEPNAIAHYRASMQPTEGGGKAYLIDELQSDWGQKLRDGGVRDEAKIGELRPRAEAAATKKMEAHAALKAALGGDDGALKQRLQEEYTAAKSHADLLDAELRTAEAATPGNPFVNTTEQWMTTALRRMMRNAAEQQADGIAITPGQVHTDRFSLAKHVTGLKYSPDTKALEYRPAGNRGFRHLETVEPDKLASYVGKEMADKLLATEKQMDGNVAWHRLDDINEEIGGEGMKYAYDKILPKLLGKELSKLDPSIKYGQQNLRYGQSPDEEIGHGAFHHFPLTPKAREEIMKGLPLFNQAGGDPGTASILEALRAQQQIAPFEQGE